MAKEMTLIEMMTELDNFRKFNMQRFQEIVADINDVRMVRIAPTLENRIKTLEEMMDGLIMKTDSLGVQIKSMMNDEKFIERFTNEEIQSLYDESGLSQKDITDKFHVTQPQAANYIKGKVEDLMIRNQLGKFLRSKCFENKAKNK